MTSDRAIHLAVIIHHAPSPHLVGSWRLPRSYRGFEYWSLDYWAEVARILERGCFDMLFFADGYNLWDRYKGSAETALRYGVQYPKHDPVPLIGHLAYVARRLGFGVTYSTAFDHPYHTARLFATLDHMTEGRIGWNIVASNGKNEYDNFGFDHYPDRDEAYARSDEFVDVCKQLWATWEDGAVIANRETGEFADPSLIHPIDHHGRFYKTKGVLPVPHSPQGQPVLLQAGGSPGGRAFAAKQAEVQFASRGSGKGMRHFRDLMVEEYARVGRSPEEVRLLWATTVFVGETEAEGWARFNAAAENAPIEACLALMSGQVGVDLSKFPLDKPMSAFEAEGVVGVADSVKEDFDPDATLREVAVRFGTGLSGSNIVGSARQVADKLEELFDESGGDGFMLHTTSLPGGLRDFVDLVVPELQQRGRLRTRYPEGATLRDLLTEDVVT